MTKRILLRTLPLMLWSLTKQFTNLYLIIILSSRQTNRAGYFKTDLEKYLGRPEWFSSVELPAQSSPLAIVSSSHWADVGWEKRREFPSLSPPGAICPIFKLSCTISNIFTSQSLILSCYYKNKWLYNVIASFSFCPVSASNVSKMSH